MSVTTKSKLIEKRLIVRFYVRDFVYVSYFLWITQYLVTAMSYNLPIKVKIVLTNIKRLIGRYIYLFSRYEKSFCKQSISHFLTLFKYSLNVYC